MQYFKIKNGNTVIGVGNTYGLQYYQEKHGVWLRTDIDHAEAIQPEGHDTLYHDYWMRQSDKSYEQATEADVIEITEEEYNTLAEQLIDDDTIIEPDEEPIPDEEEPVEDLPLTMGDLLEMVVDMDMRLCMLEMGVNLDDI